MTSDKPPIRKPSRRYLLLIALPAICGMLCAGSIWWVEFRPQFVEVPLPPIGRFFTIEETTANIYGSRYFFRRVTTDCSGCQTWQSIWERYDEQLTADGWMQVEDQLFCRSLPESHFLPNGEDGFVMYRRRDIVENNSFCEGPRVCLAIWMPDDSYLYEIAISTENPSFITEYGHCVG